MKTLNTYYVNKCDLETFVMNNFEILHDLSSTVFVQVFSGSCEVNFLKRLVNEITELVPQAHVIGTTTAGEIMNGVVSGLKTVLSFSIFDMTKVRCSFKLKNNQSDFQLGQSIASELSSDKAKVMILFATGITINSTELLSGIQSIHPTLPVVGGNAGDNFLWQQSFVFDKNIVTDCGIVGAVLESDQLHVNRHWHLGWQPIGKEMTITKADNLRVYTIDHMPAYQAYQTYLGIDNIGGDIRTAVEYPLVMTRHGVTTARIARASYADGSLGFLVDINEGEKVRFSYGHVGTILEKIGDLCQNIRLQPTESIFIYSCSSRRGFLQDNSEIESLPLQKIAPTSGFFTYGEFFHTDGSNQLLNATMTVLVLSESEWTCGSELPATVLDEDKRNNEMVKLDNVAVKSVGVLKTLTHLVNTVTHEFIEANQRLTYVGLHDPLTHLYNRAYFEEKMNYYDAYQGSVGLIICDIDCLKLMNDILGHSFGDGMICMAAEHLTTSCRLQDIIARIGGDEFAILVPDAEKSLLEEICSRIANFDKNHSGPAQSLHLSVGYALKGENAAKTMVEAFKLADLNMYRRKSAEATKVQKNIVNTLTLIESKSGVDCLEGITVNQDSPFKSIVQREWASTQIRREMERAAILLHVSSKLNESSFENVLDVLCEEIAKAIKAPAVFLHLYHQRKDEFLHASGYGCLVEARLMPYPSDLCDDQVITIEDDVYRINQMEKWLIKPSNLKKIVRVKLVHEQQIIGVLSCCISDENFLHCDNDSSLINGLADLAVVHTVKANLWQENRNQLETITVLHDNAQRLAHSLDMNDIAQDVCRTYVEAFGSPLAWLGKAEKDGSMRIIAAYPDIEFPNKIKVRWDNTPAGRGPTGEAMRNGTPIIINDIRNDPMVNLWREAAVRFGVESVAALPLISRGKSFGALTVYGDKANFFDEENAEHLQAYAHQAAAALENARLFKEAENRASRLEALREIDMAITKNLDVDKTLHTVLNQLMSRIQLDAADILLYDEESKKLTYAVGKGFYRCTDEYLKVGISGSHALKQRSESIKKSESFSYYHPFQLIAKGKLQGILEIFNSESPTQDQEWQPFVHMLANQTAIAIDGARLLDGLRNSNEELTAAYDATIEGWSRILDLRDKETEGHSQRVTQITLRLAKALGMDECELVYIRWGALLHDIGKMGIPDRILLKPGPLDEDEWEIMKKHPVYAYDMLYPIEHLRPALDIPYAHHEKWDGTGYPRGLKGEEIPLGARIFAIADVVDALASDRPYRKPLSFTWILEHVKALSGTHFDPKIVDLFIKQYPNIIKNGWMEQPPQLTGR